MPRVAPSVLGPRKTPVQARSAASVDAILEATVQVLVAVGKERLTTTQVASRAGVSVGTLYQYFPNKSALLQACLRQHVDGVSRAVEEACERHRSEGLREMATGLICAYLKAKMSSVKASVTLYSVSSDVDGAAISQAATTRARRFVVEMFASAREGLTKDPEIVATVVLAAINGIARRLVESETPELELESLREELIVLVHAYLSRCTAAPLL